LIATNPEGFSLASGELQLVELFAFWSPLSQSMAPVMYLMEDAYGDQIRFVYLDIDDPANALFKALLGNRLPPVFFLLDEQGNVLQEWQGYVKAEEFEQVFSSIIVTE
jgi:thiol-disulfide isomerase/thioredoxin